MWFVVFNWFLFILSDQDAPPPKAGKRIVFDSDDENNEDEEEKKSWAASSKKKLQDIQSEEEAVWSRAVANQRATKDKVRWIHSVFTFCWCRQK